MINVRLAQKCEVEKLKEIWKLSFIGDSDENIENYYNYCFREEETMLLLYDEEIASMLTMLPVKLTEEDLKRRNSTMVYAVATHPKYRKRGFATKLMNFTHQYLQDKNNVFSLLVPEGEHLFGFYRQLGYEDGFYVRESLLTKDDIETQTVDNIESCSIKKAEAAEYNLIRNRCLQGKQYISYDDKDIAYQKIISKQAGADIYRLQIGEIEGCAAIERLSQDKIIIKEILIPDQLLMIAVEQIMKVHHAKEYVIRMPLFLGTNLTSVVRTFGMIKATENKNIILPDENFKIGVAYLGLAFD
jgi:predicted acetyltransferase